MITLPSAEVWGITGVIEVKRAGFCLKRSITCRRFLIVWDFKVSFLWRLWSAQLSAETSLKVPARSSQESKEITSSTDHRIYFSWFLLSITYFFIFYSRKCRSCSRPRSQIDTAHPSSSWCQEVQESPASHVWRGHPGDNHTCCEDMKVHVFTLNKPNKVHRAKKVYWHKLEIFIWKGICTWKAWGHTLS